jgi:hypothetical protein
MGVPSSARTGIEPHRLRVCTTIHLLAEAVPNKRLAILAPIRIAYEMARRRCPQRVEFDLARIDLLAQLVQDSEGAQDIWVRALIHAAGTIPPGTRVQLADGRVGIALDTSQTGDGLRPSVLVGADVVTPATPVHILATVRDARPIGAHTRVRP